jgi:transcriptional regulator with XRE-family HTH domain
VSQQRLALQAAVAIGTVRAVESGRSVDPSFFTILALVDALDIDREALFDGVASFRLAISPIKPDRQPPD